jgi:hypothetical protein
MFARLAKTRAINRRYIVSAPTVPVCSNDNQPDRCRAGQMRRCAPPVLACRWQVNPATGKLECDWAIEGTEAVGPVPGSDWSIMASHGPYGRRRAADGS